MKTEFSILVASLIIASTTIAAGKDSRMGVFSNHGQEFSGASLVVDKSGCALCAAGVGGVVGKWTYDTKTSTLTLNYFDPDTGKDGSVQFKFDESRRFYNLLPTNSAATESERNIVFVTNAIPDQLASMFAKYPEEVKLERKKSTICRRPNALKQRN